MLGCILAAKAQPVEAMELFRETKEEFPSPDCFSPKFCFGVVLKTPLKPNCATT